MAWKPIADSKNSCIATLVGRHSRYVKLAKVANKDTGSVVAALIKHVRHLPRELRRWLTWDRHSQRMQVFVCHAVGKELSDHKRLTLAANIDACFCNPHGPWQRGTNENTNRPLRQNFPKGTNISVHSRQMTAPGKLHCSDQ